MSAITLPFHSYLALLLLVFSAVVLLLLIRLVLLLPALSPRPSPRRRGTPTRLLIVLGSGGHTAEMLSLLRDLDPHSYTHRSYVVSSGDDFSAQKAAAFEAALEARCTRANAAAELSSASTGQREGRSGAGGASYGSYDIAFVPRARRIHQPLLTTPVDALRCLAACWAVLCSPSISPTVPRFSPARSYPPPSTAAFSTPLTYPHLILTNGPATATILVLASLLLRLVPSFLLPFLGIPRTAGTMRCIYIESWARVRRLSLSGRILVAGGMCERVLVQWEGLAREGWKGGGWGRREFRGALVR